MATVGSVWPGPLAIYAPRLSNYFFHSQNGKKLWAERQVKISIWNDNGSCDQCNIYSSISCKPQININGTKMWFQGRNGTRKTFAVQFLFLHLILLNSSYLVWSVHLTLIVVVFTDEDDLEVRSVPLHYTWSTSVNPDIQNYNEYCFQVSESVPPYFTLIIKSQVTKD